MSVSFRQSHMGHRGERLTSEGRGRVVMDETEANEDLKTKAQAPYLLLNTSS